MEDAERKAYLDIITKLMDVILATTMNNKETEKLTQIQMLRMIGREMDSNTNRPIEAKT